MEQNLLADELEAALSTAETRRGAIIVALDTSQGAPSDLAAHNSIVGKVEALAHQLDQRIAGLKETASAEQKGKIETELQELKARQTLAKHEELVLEEI